MSARACGVSLPMAVLLAAAAPAAAQTDRCPDADPPCAQVARLVADAGVQRAWQHIEAIDEQGMRDLVTLTEIPAPPFGEEARAAKFADLLRAAGADSVWIDDEGNVLALRAGAGERVVAIAGHLDTVFPAGTDVTVRMRGDTLFAPGVGDDTRGLVVVLQMLRALEAADVATDASLLFIGTVGEEGLGDLRGVKHLFRDGGPRIDAFIAVDGGDMDNITAQALGSRRYRVTFNGPGGHSWGAFGTANPAHALGRAIHAFDLAADTFTRTGARTSYNIGRIGGGTSVNAVPFEAWFEVDMRSESQERLLRIDSLFQQSVLAALAAQNELTRRGENLTVNIELVGDRPSGETAADAPLLLRAQAVTRHFGGEPAIRRSSTDANVPISRGIPAITIDRGGVGGNAHAPEEWWLNENGAAGIQRALLITLAEAGLAGPTS
jgi:acetylornithine deacetylase/succinyl-diaminopimelate desuccinylase-like protein